MGNLANYTSPSLHKSSYGEVLIRIKRGNGSGRSSVILVIHLQSIILLGPNLHYKVLNHEVEISETSYDLLPQIRHEK